LIVITGRDLYIINLSINNKHEMSCCNEGLVPSDLFYHRACINNLLMCNAKVGTLTTNRFITSSGRNLDNVYTTDGISMLGNGTIEDPMSISIQTSNSPGLPNLMAGQGTFDDPLRSTLNIDTLEPCQSLFDSIIGNTAFFRRIEANSNVTITDSVNNLTIGRSAITDPQELRDFGCSDCTFEPPQVGGYRRDRLFAENPFDPRRTNFDLLVCSSPDGYGINMGFGNTFPNDGTLRGSVIGGGESNVMNIISGSNPQGATILGGLGNTVSGNYDVVCGGQTNTIFSTLPDLPGTHNFCAGHNDCFIDACSYSVVGSGDNNYIYLSTHSGIAANSSNYIENSNYCAIGGNSNYITISDYASMGWADNAEINNADYAVAFSQRNTVSANHAVGIGNRSNVSGVESTNISGVQGLVSGLRSALLGGGTAVTSVSGDYSVNLNNQTNVSGDTSTAIGSESVGISGNFSSLVGTFAVSSGNNCVVMGRSNDAGLSNCFVYSGAFAGAATDPNTIFIGSRGSLATLAGSVPGARGSWFDLALPGAPLTTVIDPVNGTPTWSYTSTVPGGTYAVANPTNIANALDRIAAAVSTFYGSAIP
jgi:hypothetical protein